MVDLNPENTPRILALPVTLNKQVAMKILEAIENNQPIEPPAGEWGYSALLALAAAATTTVGCDGPGSWPAVFSPEEIEAASSSTDEGKQILAIFAHLLRNTSATYNSLMMAAIHKIWDDKYDDDVELIVHADRRVEPVRGVRPKPL